jgi:hypothetical protein
VYRRKRQLGLTRRRAEGPEESWFPPPPPNPIDDMGLSPQTKNHQRIMVSMAVVNRPCLPSKGVDSKL